MARSRYPIPGARSGQRGTDLRTATGLPVVAVRSPAGYRLIPMPKIRVFSSSNRGAVRPCHPG